MEGARILLVDPDAALRERVAPVLAAEGLSVLEADGVEGALEAARSSPVDALLLPAPARGAEAVGLLERVRAVAADAAVVVGCRRDGVAAAVEAMRAGADGFVVLPEEALRAGLMVKRALEKRQLRLESRALRARARSRLSLIGTSAETVAVGEVIRRVAPTKATVLLTGEAGTGKSLVAEVIHESSPRRDRPFVRANCAGLSETLLEIGLFGTEKADADHLRVHRDGLVDAAHGGTLYLEEVSHLPPSLQVRLLRLLQQGEFERLAGGETRHADVRVVASTRADLGEEVRAGRFRDDLYYRLNVVSLSLPPLRTRKGDIPALASHFLAHHGAAAGRPVRGLTPGALSALFAYDWPGNVRELQGAMELACESCVAELAGIEDLPRVLHAARPEETGTSALIPGASLFEIEREAILRTLESVGGSTARAAEVLGVSVRKVQYRLKEYRTGHAAPRGRHAHDDHPGLIPVNLREVARP